MKEKANNLKHLVKCSLCGEKYHHDKTVVLEDNESGATFHVTCGKCKTSVLIFVSNQQQSVISVGIATDVGSEEVENFFKKDVVNVDDILNAYKSLNR